MGKGVTAKFVFIIGLMLLLSGFVEAGSSRVSIEKDLSWTDTLRILPLLEKGEAFIFSQPDSALVHFQQAAEIAASLDYNKGFLDYVSYVIRLYNSQGKYQDALLLTEEALIIAQETENPVFLANAHNNIANEYIYLGNLELAVKHSIEALKLAEELQDSVRLRKFTNNLASSMINLGEKEKAMNYALRSYQIAVALKDSAALASSLVNLANCEVLFKNYEQAENRFRELIRISRRLNDPSYELDALINLAHLFSENGNHRKALENHQEALQVLENYPVPDYQLYVHWGMAQSYHNLQQHQSAAWFLDSAIRIAKEIQAAKELRYIVLLGSEITEALGDINSALTFRKEYEMLNDSIVGEETRKNIQQLEVEYQISTKEKEIAQQQLEIARNQAEIETKNKWIVIGIAAIILLMLLAMMSYLIYRHRQKQANERLKMLEKDKEIEILEALIEGEERERTRIARELHDGIGGILSAGKMHLSIAANKAESPEIGQSLQLMDHAASEIRNIAHNLSPDLLLRYGVGKAVESFCERVSHPKLPVSFYSYGELPRFKPNFEMTVYRIVQELVNNIIKHSEANQAFVQMNYHAYNLSIAVEDNGKGLDGFSSEGIGILTLKSRAADGTSVNLNFDVSRYLLNSTTKTVA